MTMKPVSSSVEVIAGELNFDFLGVAAFAIHICSIEADESALVAGVLSSGRGRRVACATARGYGYRNVLTIVSQPVLLKLFEQCRVVRSGQRNVVHFTRADKVEQSVPCAVSVS